MFSYRFTMKFSRVGCAHAQPFFACFVTWSPWPIMFIRFVYLWEQVLPTHHYYIFCNFLLLTGVLVPSSQIFDVHPGRGLEPSHADAWYTSPAEDGTRCPVRQVRFALTARYQMPVAAGTVRPYGKVPDARLGRYVSPLRQGARCPWGQARQVLTTRILDAHGAGQPLIHAVATHRFSYAVFTCLCFWALHVTRFRSVSLVGQLDIRVYEIIHLIGKTSFDYIPKSFVVMLSVPAVVSCDLCFYHPFNCVNDMLSFHLLNQCRCNSYMPLLIAHDRAWNGIAI